MTRMIGFVAILAALAVPAGAATLLVPQQYPTIPAAIQAAQSGDVIQVAAGTFTDLVDLQIPGVDTIPCLAIMKSGITLRGSGIGQTILDAQTLGRGIHCDSVTAVTIRDMTIKRANWPTYGSGIFVKNDSNVLVQNCEIKDNLDGGIIYLDHSHGTIAYTTMLNNLAKQGGGLAIEEGCDPLVYRCTVQGNAAPSGGGVFIRALSAPVIDDCTIQSNTINSLSGAGGGIMMVNSNVTVRNSRILSNTADGQGGGVAAFDASTLTVTKTTIQGNRTAGDYGPGGGIYLDFSSMSLDDVAVVRNSVDGGSSDGAGIFAFFGGSVTINQTTISANACNGLAGGAGGLAVFFSSPVVTKTIISHNSPGSAMVCYDGSDNPNVSCTDIYGNQGGNAICGTSGLHNFSLDPLFCDMANNNFRLQMTSPCYPGNHPDGGHACDRDRIGGVDPGCNPADAEEGETLPTQVRLIGNQPNPFRPLTTISFDLPTDGRARLAVYDVAGRMVRSLVDGPLEIGRHEIIWDGRDDAGAMAPSGVYFYRLRTEGGSETRRMVLTR